MPDPGLWREASRGSGHRRSYVPFLGAIFINWCDSWLWTLGSCLHHHVWFDSGQQCVSRDLWAEEILTGQQEMAHVHFIKGRSIPVHILCRPARHLLDLSFFTYLYTYIPLVEKTDVLEHIPVRVRSDLTFWYSPSASGVGFREIQAGLPHPDYPTPFVHRSLIVLYRSLSLFAQCFSTERK